jgi:hypothetical protein
MEPNLPASAFFGRAKAWPTNIGTLPEMPQAGSDGSRIIAAPSPASIALAQMVEKPE